MKNRRFYLLSVLVILFITICSCKDDREEPSNTFGSITFPSTEDMQPVFPSQGGTTFLSFTATEDWTAALVNTRADGWITISPASGGKGEVEIGIITEANDTFDERNATIVLKCGTDTKNIVVTQKQKDALTITSSKYEVERKGGNISIEVKANIEFEVEIKSDWIKQIKNTRALATSNLNFSIEPNETEEKREGEIIIKSGELSETVKIYQGNGDFITLTQKDFTLSEEGGNVDVEIKSTLDYEVKMLSEIDWITEIQTRAISTHTRHYEIAPNESDDSREAKIVFYNPKDESIADTISIYQMYKGAILVARDEYQFGNKGGILNFKVVTNVEMRFDVVITDSWIRQVEPTRALMQSDLSFIISENAEQKDREGKVIIKDKNSDKQQLITVKQSYVDLEREALIAFYKATNGDNWINNTNWCSDKPISEWYGITRVGSLYSLELGNNNLTGILPKEIGKLITFTHLTLWDNQLSGEIPKEIGELINLRGLYLNNNKLSGKIPDEIWTLPSLAFLHLSGNKLSGEISSAIQNAKGLEQISLMNNLLTGTLPNEIYGLSNLTELSIDGNQLDGNISENIGQLIKLRRFSAAQAGLKGEIPNSIYQLYSLEELILNGNSLSGRISENIENLQKLDLFDISNNNITGNIPKNIGNIKSLTRFLVNGNNIEGNIPEEFVDLPLLKLLWLFGNRLQGSIPGKLLRSPKWKTWIPTFDILPQQNGYTLLEEDFYASSDFSKDGEITILQTHTKGNGIKLVVMGDLFVDTDMESGGKYETMMKKAVENYFSVEPFKSLREYYDVVSIKAVSKNDLMSGESAFETKWTTQFYGDENKCQEYARKALGVSNLDNIQVIMVLNVCIGMANCSWYTNSFSIANCPYGGNSDDTFEELIHHEANGHGFGFLHDEYSNVDYGIISAPDIEAKQRAYNNYGWFANIDFTSDPSQVKWKHFINDSRYINESIGVFEGALFEKGIYRPTEFSIMRTTQGQFNAPSREAIYKRAMKLAYGDDWVYDYEKFVEFDAPARTATRSIPYPSRILKNTKHVPPIIYNYPAVPQ